MTTDTITSVDGSTVIETNRRHPVELTAARLADHVDAYSRHLTPAEVDTLAEATEVLDALRSRLEWASRRRERTE